WLDELSYTDPAATWHFQHQFASTIWDVRGEPFWVGNVPLHQILLGFWMKLFGFSIYVVRGASLVYTVLGALILYLGLQRAGWLASLRARLLFLVTFLSGTGCVALYRNGRYDALGFLLVAGAVVCTLERKQPLL